MIADIWTIMWKDWKELLLQRGARRGWLNLVILMLVFGIFLPLQTGVEWVRSPLVMVSWAWVPVLLVINVVADSFAGERERHTLETLLASRMPDQSILLGKTFAAVSYGWGVSVISLILGLLTVNAAHWHGHLLLYPAAMAVGGTALSLLMAGLAAGVGILVSLRAPTVRQAQQTLGVVTMLALWVPILGVNLLPQAWKANLSQMLGAVNEGQALAAGVLFLTLLDLALIAMAMARFRRAQLILD